MKKLIIIILTLLLSLTLAACSEALEANESTDNFSVQSSAVNIDTEQSFTAASGESITEETSNETSKETSEETSEETSKETSEETSTEESSEETSEVSEEPRLSKLELVASLKVGEDILYTDGIGCLIEGPQSYCVNDNGHIYIVSGYERKIICMNDKKNISINECGYPCNIACDGDTVYVLDLSNNVCEYDINKGFIRKFALPGEITYLAVHKMDVVNGKLTLRTSGYDIYTLEEHEFIKSQDIAAFIGHKTDNIITININDKSISIDGTNIGFNVLGYDDTGIYVEELEEISDSYVLIIETSVKKYDYKSNLLEYAIFDFNDCKAYPLYPIVYADGDIYLMKCTAETVDVYTVTLGNADVSHLYDS